MASVRQDSRRGNSALEFVFLLPWFIFLFVGVFDWGFFARGLLSTENAARVSALYNAQMNRPTDNASACIYALSELRTAVNISPSLTTCDALPVIVTATQETGPDGMPAAQVAVQYQVQQLLPIPGLLSGQYTFNRIVKFKL